MKNKIRQNILNIRNSFIPSEIIVQKIVENVYKAITPEGIIAGYYPIASELNILPLLGELKKTAQIVLPAINNSREELDFYIWDKEMVHSKYYPSILEPSYKQEKFIPSILIVPLIACDVYGNRIGSGKAMYDRTIARLRSYLNKEVLVVGICYNFQVLEEQIPFEPHDQKLNLIITEKKIIRIK